MAKRTNLYSTKAGESSTCFLPTHGKPLQDTSEASSGNSSDVKVPSNNKVFRPSDNPYNLVAGSAVQYFEKYGVVRWIGMVPGDKKVYAKVEMVINLYYIIVCS